MGLNIIIKKKNKYGYSRAEQESNLRKDGFVGMRDADYDRAKWIEKRTGWKGFLPGPVIDNTDMSDGTSSKYKK